MYVGNVDVEPAAKVLTPCVPAGVTWAMPAGVSGRQKGPQPDAVARRIQAAQQDLCHQQHCHVALLTRLDLQIRKALARPGPCTVSPSMRVCIPNTDVNSGTYYMLCSYLVISLQYVCSAAGKAEFTTHDWRLIVVSMLKGHSHVSHGGGTDVLTEIGVPRILDVNSLNI